MPGRGQAVEKLRDTGSSEVPWISLKLGEERRHPWSSYKPEVVQRQKTRQEVTLFIHSFIHSFIQQTFFGISMTGDRHGGKLGAALL